MAIAKVIFNDGSSTTTWMDVTQDTVVSSNLLSGESATRADGVSILGTYVPPSFSTMSSTYTPTETTTTITPLSGYDGFSQVKINGISSTYVGTGITRRSAADLASNGAYITAPIGYYSSAVSKAVATATQATPGITVTANGLITATATQTAGYVVAGTKTSTSQLTSVAGTTVTPTTASQLAVSSARWTTGSVYVGPIPSQYIVPTGSISISENGTYDVSAFANAVVDVPSSGGLYQVLSVIPKNGSQTIFPGSVSTIFSSSYKSGYSNNSSQALNSYFTNNAANKYYRINGQFNLSFSSNNANISATLSNVIFKGAEGTGAFTHYFMSNSEIISHPGLSVVMNGAPNVENFFYSRNAGGYTYIYMAWSGTRSQSYIAQNVTIDVADDETFQNYDAISQVNVLGLADVGVIDMSKITQHNAISNWIDSKATYIGPYAFTNIAVSNVTVPNASWIGTSAFEENAWIRTVSVPLVTEIEFNAFAYAGSLSSIYCPNVVSLGASAFRNTSLTSFEGSKVESIDYDAFRNANKLSAVSFPLVTLVSSGTFAYCSSLANVYIPNLTSVYENAFASCIVLPSINFLALTTISGTSTFANCRSLSYANLPEFSNVFGSLMFQSCSSLTTFIAPKLNNVAWGMFSSCGLLSDLQIGSNVSFIGSNAFLNCSALSSIDLTKAVNVYMQAFNGTPITSFAFPSVATVRNGVFKSNGTVLKVDYPIATTCESQAFMAASNLTTVCFRSGVASITSSVFMSCYNLLSLYLLGSTMATLVNTMVFYNTPISTYTTSTGGVYGSIYVPSSLYASYIAATNWKTYSARFVSMTDAQISAFLSSLG